MTQQLLDNCPFPPIIELLSTDSTNNYALALLRDSNLTERQKKVEHGCAVFAHEQYAGKGQRGKKWVSQKGKNIHLSVIIHPKNLNLHQQFTLIALTAITVRNFLDQYAYSDLTIKWPNDIYFMNRKLGGILIENIIIGAEWKWAVVGIGLNINQVYFEPEIAKKAVSLKQITGKNFNCLEIAHLLRNEILLKYDYYSTHEMNIIMDYNQFLFKKNKTVILEKDGQQFEAFVKEVLPNGQLLASTNVDHCFNFGDVNWVMD